MLYFTEIPKKTAIFPAITALFVIKKHFYCCKTGLLKFIQLGLQCGGTLLNKELST